MFEERWQRSEITPEEMVEVAYLKAMRRAGKKAVLWENFDPAQTKQLVLTARQMALWDQLEK